ncbi:DUF5683 domain-containing protein [Pedobacter aquatilis]|uniref:DUF5683 domain-containing protein n=1 Tax=Pedobacter aquatilis TaxID=351343 RepID=UPI0025B5D529|nr:DUF5683 domain-containing protein [Pedobacter aquatilis]MDN3586732.1 DUF5683 domain-containing protein [Pedobacter aquatilis]
MLNNKLLVTLFLVFIFLANLASAQVQDTLLKPIDTIKTTPIKAVPMDTARKKTDTIKYVNPGKVAGRKAVFRSMLIPGWGQLYNNQLLNNKLNAKGEKTGHFWQRTYTLGKVGLIYGGFGALTLSYIESRKNYKIFLTEAQNRAFNKLQTDTAKLRPLNPDLTRYGDTNVLDAQAIYKRNSQIVIFSYFAVYAVQIIDAYVAARLNFFDVDDKLSFKVTPTLINNPNAMYGFNQTPALKLSLRF